ncbi:MAG: DUF3102 domain-containing protein [Desulfobacteraceae bacterium]|nr:DUF3102 domain-containing protein [Desulfobacteraceae bacterium]
MNNSKSGHAQAIIDQGEIDIAEDNMAMNDNIATIDLAGKNQAERQLSLGIAAKYLDGQEYDLDRITAQVQVHIEHITQGFVAVGRLLMAVKEVEGHGKFAKWLEENFSFSHRTANYFMFVANKLEQRPELAQLAKGGIAKALTLLDLPEDYQTEFINSGNINEQPLDKYINMSHKELREEVKKLKNNMDKEVAEETKALKKERDMLIGENKRLKKFEPEEEKTTEWCLEQVQEISRAVFGLSTLCHKFTIDERLQDDLPLQAKIESLITTARKELREFDREWNEKFNSYEG